MRLFLSSQGFGNHADRLISMLGENKKMLFIDNAKDYLVEFERSEHALEKKQEFERIGLPFEELDLRDYFGEKTELAKKLHNIGGLFVSGGNTFILRRAMRYSGLDELIIDHMMRDQFLYAGSSAGAIVVTPNLHGTEYGDNPYISPSQYDEQVIWEGLNLVDFHIVPHYLSDWFGAQAHEMVDYFERKELPYKTLMDGQVYIEDGTHKELLS